MWTKRPLQDVRVPAEMGAPHATGLIEMSIRSFQSLTASPLQRHPSPAADAPPVRVDRVACRCLLLPPAAAPIRFGDVGAQVERGQIDEQLIAVVPLVRHHLVDHCGLPVRRGRHGFEFLGRRRDRVGDRGRIALIGALHRDAHDRAGGQVDRVLSLVREMYAPVLHLRDARVRIVRMSPVRVPAFLGALPIEAGQVRARRRLDPRGLREACQKVPRVLLVADGISVSSDRIPLGESHTRYSGRHWLPVRAISQLTKCS